MGEHDEVDVMGLEGGCRDSNQWPTSPPRHGETDVEAIRHLLEIGMVEMTEDIWHCTIHPLKQQIMETVILA